MDRPRALVLADALPPQVRRQARWAVASVQHRRAVRRWQKDVARRTARHASAGRRSRALAVAAAALALAVPVPGGPDVALLAGAAGTGALAAHAATSGRRPLELPPRPVGPVPLTSSASPLADRLAEQSAALSRLLQQVQALDAGCRADVEQARAAGAELARSLTQRAAAVAELERVAAVLPPAEAAAVRAPVPRLCAALEADLAGHASLVTAAVELATAVATAPPGDPTTGARLADAVQGLRARAAGVEVAARAGTPPSP